jgi:hypothetical protein
MATAAELNYNTNASAMQMAETIFGDGVTVVSASYTGDNRASAIYSGGDSLAPGVTPSDTGVILSTGYAASYTNSSGGGWKGNSSNTNQSSNTSTNNSGINNNADFNALAGTSTYDASWLDVDFVPEGNVMTISFVFASDEYPEYVNSQYLDMVGIWVNGEPVEMVIGDASVNNINPLANENLYLDNTGDAYNTEMDGVTVTLSVSFPVTAGVLNSLRIGIADVSDSSYDSNVLIAAGSVQTTLIATDDSVWISAGETKTIDVLGNEVNATGGTLTVTHINGIAVNPGDSVTLVSGEVVTLNADGTLTIATDSPEEVSSFTYTVASSTGHSDIGFVTVDTVPCFVAGTLIDTPEGPRPVESLRVGDLVLTQDDGAQPLRWVGARRVAATGSFAPIRIRAGRFGATRDLLVSPQHRVLVRDPLAALMFGEAEVLVAAKDLVDGRSVTVEEGGEVTYLHLLFDRHQVIFSEGMATESFLPGPQVMGGLEAAVQAEICALFPEIDPQTGQGYGPAARQLLRAYEARLLLSRAA